MSTSLNLLQAYDSDDEITDNSQSTAQSEYKEQPKIDPSFSLISSITIDSAPVVPYSKDQIVNNYIPQNSELTYNPRFEDMWAPRLGPDNPNVSDFHKSIKNTLTGYVESANVNEFHFENQRKTFIAKGIAYDPSIDANNKLIVADYFEGGEKTDLFTSVDEKAAKSANAKRKKDRNDDPSDIDGFLGPWASYKDQELVSKPSDEQRQKLSDMLSKRSRYRNRNKEEAEDMSKSTLHIDDPVDYMGRSFLHIPQDLDVNLLSEDLPTKCFIPKKNVHTYTGHTKGIQKIQFFPKSAHLFLTCSMDNRVKLWEFYKGRRCIRTYAGHAQGVRDVSFNRTGTEFLSASFDRFIKLWDTETGQVKAKFTNKKIPYCVEFNTDVDKENLFVAGTSDKKILCWDTRSGEIVQEYDRHLGAVNTVTFVDNNKRLVSTSDDKSIRIWEWDIPVDFKYLADPSMHSMPAVRLSHNGRYLAFQSMDNQIKIMEPNANFRWKNKKVFRGHLVAGYACGMDFSPDMSYVISGDADGRIVIWDWKSTRIFERIKAHTQVCMDVKWHPHETSKILSCGWDGVVHLWD